MTKQIPQGAVLTIRRPSGQTEEVINTQHAVAGVISAKTYAAMVKATREAGRGDILSQRPNMVEIPLSLQRAELVGRCNDGGAFPGSRAWTAARQAEQALQAFDAEHPEVVEQINADRAARTAEGVARALKMED